MQPCKKTVYKNMLLRSASLTRSLRVDDMNLSHTFFVRRLNVSIQFYHEIKNDSKKCTEKMFPRISKL